MNETHYKEIKAKSKKQHLVIEVISLISDISCVSKHFKYISAHSADALGPSECKISTLH